MPWATKSKWKNATAALEQAVKAEGLEFEVDEGGGAFYGPKIDIKIKDALNREWQCSTIQFDFNEPERFDITYVGPEQRTGAPVHDPPRAAGLARTLHGRTHRALCRRAPAAGSRRCRSKCSPISEKTLAYGRSVADKLRDAGLRAELDDRNEKIGYKIRDAEMKKIPFMAVVGEKEVEGNAVSVRCHGKGDQGSMALGDFIALAAKEGRRL